MNSDLMKARRIAVEIYNSNNPNKYEDYIGNTKWQKCCVAAFNRWRDEHDGKIAIMTKMFFNYTIDEMHQDDWEWKKGKLFELINKYMKLNRNITLKNE